MSGYVKLFGSILDSTVWETPLPTKVVWITMIAMADQDGLVSASVPGLARRAGVSREDCETALAAFLSPDPDSRTKDYEGRRIEEADGGWMLLNHAKYRGMKTPEERREKDAERQRRHRERNALSRDKSRLSRPVTTVAENPPSDQIRSPQIISDQQREIRAPVTVRDGTWRPHEWLRTFGQAWAQQYGQIAYGQPGDSKACSTLADALDALPQAERIAAQAKAPGMIAEFLASTDPRVIARRHPFAFFVQEWGGLRVTRRYTPADGISYPKLLPVGKASQ